jgi:hypothetical protein
MISIKNGTKSHQPATKTSNDKNQGGFLRDVPLLERLLHIQQQQAKVRAAPTLPRNRAITETSTTTATATANARRSKDITQRRKTTRKSIWNVDTDKDEEKFQTKMIYWTRAAVLVYNLH